MKLARLAALAALVAGVAAEGAAAQAKVVSLPWPPSVLPRMPPLAPATSGVLPLQPRFLHQLTNRERVVVGLDEDGTPNSVRVLQTIVVEPLGDYVFTVPAPVLSVAPGPETQSQPGQRENQILWEGFSPGNRTLAAWADLRLAESATALPVEIRVEPGELTIRNATGVTVRSFTADPEPVSLAQVNGRVRAAIRANVFPEGLNIGVRGKTIPVSQRVAAPLRVDGSVRVSGRRVPVSALLDGLGRTELRVPLPDRVAKIDLRVRTAELQLPPPSRDRRALLAQTIRLELTYARMRQYDQFLASPDQTGPSSTTYVFRTAARRQPSATPSPAERDEDHTVGWIVLGLGLVVAVPVAAVIWAHS